jgi:predicted porin
MQKKIIALAIAGLSSAAFAQSTVTISGMLDAGYNVTKSQAAGVTTSTTLASLGNNSGTSNVTLTASEGLGGGMKAGVLWETDPTVTSATGAVFGNSQNYVYLQGNFGDFRLGFSNNFALTTSSTSQPFGTAIGSGYSGNFSRLMGISTVGPQAWTAVGGNAAGARAVRTQNAIMYTSPSFSGFTVGGVYKAKNSDAAVAAANAEGSVQLAANYNNGPLNVSFTNEKTTGAINSTLFSVANGFTNGGSSTHNMLAANYTFGPATVYGGWTSSKSSGKDGVGFVNTDNRSWNLALKWNVTSTIALMANVLKDDDKTTANADRNLNGLGLDYAMSKRTTAYARYERGDKDRSSATGATTGDFSQWAAGLRHSF